jgi:hypothetical protein
MQNRKSTTGTLGAFIFRSLEVTVRNAERRRQMEAAIVTRPFRDPSGQVHVAGERALIVGHVNDAVRGHCWRAKFANGVPVMFTATTTPFASRRKLFSKPRKDRHMIFYSEPSHRRAD